MCYVLRVLLWFQQSSQTIIDNVPDRENGWEKEFVVPKQYSTAVMAVITQNKISSNIRNQIVQDVTTKMLSYCKYSSAEQYETVSKFRAGSRNFQKGGFHKLGGRAITENPINSQL